MKLINLSVPYEISCDSHWMTRLVLCNGIDCDAEFRFLTWFKGTFGPFLNYLAHKVSNKLGQPVQMPLHEYEREHLNTVCELQ